MTRMNVEFQMLTTFENDLMYFNQIKSDEKSDEKAIIQFIYLLFVFIYFLAQQLFVVYLFTLNYSNRNSFPWKGQVNLCLRHTLPEFNLAWIKHVSLTISVEIK